MRRSNWRKRAMLYELLVGVHCGGHVGVIGIFGGGVHNNICKIIIIIDMLLLIVYAYILNLIYFGTLHLVYVNFF